MSLTSRAGDFYCLPYPFREEDLQFPDDFHNIYPLGRTNIALENGPFILSFPMKNCDFPHLGQFTGGYNMRDTLTRYDVELKIFVAFQRVFMPLGQQSLV